MVKLVDTLLLRGSGKSVRVRLPLELQNTKRICVINFLLSLEIYWALYLRGLLCIRESRYEKRPSGVLAKVRSSCLCHH